MARWIFAIAVSASVLAGCAAQLLLDPLQRSPAEIQLVFRDEADYFTSLFRTAKSSKPDLAPGKIVVSLTIAPNGKVTDCHLVSSTYNWPPLESAVMAHVRELQFIARDVPEYTYPNYPIVYFTHR